MSVLAFQPRRKVTEPPHNGNTVQWRLTQVEKRLDDLEKKVDRMTMAIVGAALTFAISVGVFAITLLASGPT